MANRRPRRGPRDGRNILISGDTGPREPQGGARPMSEEYRESGDLEAREFGVPQADIPGGVRHLVNPETIPHKPPGVYERPADYHKYHGVESDDGQYYPPPDDVGKPRGTVPVPKISDAVPVYIVEEGTGKRRVIRTLISAGPLGLAAGVAHRIADRDPNRVKFWISVEAGAVRIGEEHMIEQGQGLVIQAGTGNAVLQRFQTQDELWAVATFAAAATISWAAETEIPAAGA